MDNYLNERIEWRKNLEKQLRLAQLIGDSIVDGSKHDIYYSFIIICSCFKTTISSAPTEFTICAYATICVTLHC